MGLLVRTDREKKFLLNGSKHALNYESSRGKRFKAHTFRNNRRVVQMENVAVPPSVFSCSRQEWCEDSCQKTGGCCLVSHGSARQPPRQRCVAACRKAGARAGGGARGGSTGDSEPAPDGLSLSAAADGGRYTCVHAPAATGHPPASTSSGSGDQQLSESQHPTTTVTKPISSASIMYTSAFPTQQK
uniref:SFRICE_033182 n=1 Tax=Spodoptera frugiperda TaxID=7108 RepID=A0A2H1X045_SPOFR